MFIFKQSEAMKLCIEVVIGVNAKMSTFLESHLTGPARVSSPPPSSDGPLRQQHKPQPIRLFYATGTFKMPPSAQTVSFNLEPVLVPRKSPITHSYNHPPTTPHHSLPNTQKNQANQK